MKPNDNYNVHHELLELARRVYGSLTPTQRDEYHDWAEAQLEAGAEGASVPEPTDAAVQLYLTLACAAPLAKRAFPDPDCRDCRPATRERALAVLELVVRDLSGKSVN